MVKIAKFIAVFILCIFSVIALANEQPSNTNATGKNITVEIDYGNIRPSRTVIVPRTKDRTILEVLQTIAEVKTHPADQYVFVVSIDGIEGKRGEMAWYYTVNDKSPDKLAYSNILNNKINHIKWTYKKDVCSKKVDG